MKEKKQWAQLKVHHHVWDFVTIILYMLLLLVVVIIHTLWYEPPSLEFRLSKQKERFRDKFQKKKKLKKKKSWEFFYSYWSLSNLYCFSCPFDFKKNLSCLFVIGGGLSLIPAIPGGKGAQKDHKVTWGCWHSLWVLLIYLMPACVVGPTHHNPTHVTDATTYINQWITHVYIYIHI